MLGFFSLNNPKEISIVLYVPCPPDIQFLACGLLL